MSIKEVRENLAEALGTAKTEVVFIERYGKRVGALVSAERYDELMEALEDIEDAAVITEALAEEGPNIPWEQVVTDLGWSA